MATVLAAWLMLALLAAAVGGLTLARVVQARQSARIGADLAALSAASGVAAGRSGEAACARASAAAEAVGADVIGCRVEGIDTVVEVRRRLPPLGVLTWPAEVRAVARAGPP